MFHKILLPLDLTDRHQAALALAAELAGAQEGEIVLLHVIEVPPGLPVSEERKFYERLERSARKHLKQYADALKKKKIACQQEVLFGHRAREVTQCAESVGADLIILSAPRVTPENPTGWGSLSFKIGILAACPVLLVK